MSDAREWGRVVRDRLSVEDADVVEELAQHAEARFAELRLRGLSDDEARRRVLEEMPDAALLGRARRPRREPVPLGRADGARLAGVWRDLALAARALRSRPVFALAALLTLGLGVGAATAVFSLVDGVVLRPLPYAHPDRLVMLFEGNTAKGLARQPLSPVNLMDYRALGRDFDDVAAWWRPEVDLVDDVGEPIRVPTVEASENLFRVLGVAPQIGRAFPITPRLYGTEAEAVISDRLWRTRFGAAPSTVGRTVRLNGAVFTVVGVMPPGFQFPGETDVWQRLQWDMTQHSRGAHFMGAVARLAPGVAPERATRDLAALGARLGAEHTATNAGWAAEAVPLRDDVAGVFRPGLLALFGASGLLLLVACINVANLLLARATTRRAETAVRTALGATRARLVRQLLAESLVLGTAGTALGLLVAWAAVRGFLAWTPVDVPRAAEVGMHAPVLAFAAVLALATTLAFGLAPALAATRDSLQSTLRDHGRGMSGGRVARRQRSALVVAEVAFAVALLCGAGLLVRTVSTLLRQHTGVAAPESAVAVDVQLPDARYQDWTRVASFYASLMTGVRTHAGVTAAGATNFLPLDAGWRIPFRIVDAPSDDPQGERTTQYVSVDEGYFHALGVRLLRGRTFEARDDADAPGVVVINETMARRFWPDENPVGRRVALTSRNIGPLGHRIRESAEAEIVGVVSDVKNTALTEAPEPAMYSSARQFPFRKLYVVLRGAGGSATLAAVVRDEVRRLDPSLTLGRARSLDRVLAASVDPPRLVMLLMVAFAAVALLLAAVGIYGILSYTVQRRRREFGVRLALGARPSDVLRPVVREALGLALGGAAIGVALAVAGGRFLAGLLYGVTPADPLTMLAVVSVVLAVTLASSVLPGRRAARTDPGRTLRDD
ncbi:permease [Gemmatirosa kalamazoonensis]|uniref:Permease n=1 Tax=Gemmatirosa kalamazoonensis TaxID=861299 RepID=W0RDY7_9BACT|nr:ABC transporter permease [Gemmatirosa kalamazoonensis]AHG89021.1 permease [Gemmatirosa kalamazoonensis]